MKITFFLDLELIIVQPTILLESFKANPIRLATVEERDPECVQHIRLCQVGLQSINDDRNRGEMGLKF